MKMHRVFALLLKYFYITKNRLDRLFDLIYWPLLNLILWGFASYFMEDISNLNIIGMVLGAAILWIFIWRSAQDIATFVLEDFWSYNLYHLFSSPVKLSEHVFSILILGLIRALISFFLLSGLAFIVYAFNIFSVPLFFICIAVFLLTLFGWSVGLFIISMIFRFGKGIQVLAWSVVFLLQPFSCIFYPLSSLPPWAAGIAKLLPTTYVFENLRSLLAGGAVNYGQLTYTFVLDIMLLCLAGILLKSSFEKARKTGLLARSD